MSTEIKAKLPRRVVAGIRNGKSVFVSDDTVSNAHLHQCVPGFMTSVCWATPSQLSLPLDASDPSLPGIRITPAPGETRLMIVRFPPDSVTAGPSFDPLAADAEQRRHLPGLAELFECEAPGMHTTDTVDYDIVLEGEIWRELDDGAEVHLRQGDVVIQCGTRHAWRNKAMLPVTMAFILIGATRS
jgi:hypothetical protein